MNRPSEVFTRGRITHEYTDALVEAKRRARWIGWAGWGVSLTFYGYAFYLLLEKGARMTQSETMLLGIGAIGVGLVWWMKGERA